MASAMIASVSSPPSSAGVEAALAAHRTNEASQSARALRQSPHVV
jgi:hypothetical protein